jgi:sterol desaturase/sphingolipid hydroxylase (fatty acid hydroxylase superfamily)
MEKKMKSYQQLSNIYFLVGLLLVVGGPLAIIWSINTLFEFGILYTFWNWFAVIVLYYVGVLMVKLAN